MFLESFNARIVFFIDDLNQLGMSACSALEEFIGLINYDFMNTRVLASSSFTEDFAELKRVVVPSKMIQETLMFSNCSLGAV